MIQIAIEIGTVKTLSVEDWQVIPDDRQTRLETIGGVVVQDFGHVEEGDAFSCVVTIRPADVLTLYMYWNSRARVNVIDEGGVVHENLRVIFKDYAPVPHFADYWRIPLEFWRK